MKLYPHLLQRKSSGVHAKCEIRSLLVLLITTPPWTYSKVFPHTKFQTDILQQIDTWGHFLPPQSHHESSARGSLHTSLCFPGMSPPAPRILFHPTPALTPTLVPLLSVYFSFKVCSKFSPLLPFSPKLSILSLVTLLYIVNGYVLLRWHLSHLTYCLLSSLSL